MMTNAEAKAMARTGNSEIQGSFDLALRACAQDDDDVRVVVNIATNATAKTTAKTNTAAKQDSLRVISKRDNYKSAAATIAVMG
jgi:hypothetical protein